MGTDDGTYVLLPYLTVGISLLDTLDKCVAILLTVCVNDGNRNRGVVGNILGEIVQHILDSLLPTSLLGDNCQLALFVYLEHGLEVKQRAKRRGGCRESASPL